MERNDENPTNDLRQFGYTELQEAARLLTALTDSCPDWLGDSIQLWFNNNSGCVFSSDEDYNVGMMNGNTIEQWHNCPECGHEGFKEDLPHNEDNAECQAWLKDVQQ